MLAALDNGKGVYEVRSRPVPQMLAGCAMVRVHTVGICGSDLHMTNERQEPQQVPTGHEFAGEIVEMPSGYSGELKVGDRVAVECIGAGRCCGDCFYCNHGEFRHCLNPIPDTGGGFAQYVTRRPRGMFKLTSDMDYTDGALVEPIAVCVHALRFSAMQPGGTVAVVGAATIGLSAILVARAFGAKRIIASARHPQQAQLARIMGADVVVSDQDGELQSSCKDATNGRGADITVETIGGTSIDTLQQAVASTRPLGKVIVVGGFRTALPFEFLYPMLNEIQLLLPVCYSNRDGQHDFEIAVDLLANGKSPYRQIVTHTFGLEDIQQGFATSYDKTTGSVKVHVAT